MELNFHGKWRDESVVSRNSLRATVMTKEMTCYRKRRDLDNLSRREGTFRAKGRIGRTSHFIYHWVGN